MADVATNWILASSAQFGRVDGYRSQCIEAAAWHDVCAEALLRCYPLSLANEDQLWSWISHGVGRFGKTRDPVRHVLGM